MALNLQKNFKDIFGVDALPVLDQVMLDSIEQAEDPRARVFNMASMDREIIQQSSMDSLGLYSEVGEGEAAPKDAFDQSFDQTFTALKFAKVIGISEEMIADQRFDIIQRMIRSMGRSAQETRNVLAMNVFNNAFGSQTSWDGQALVATTHPSQSGDQSNSEGNVALSVSTLQSAETTFRKTKDQRGKQLLLKPRVLLVPEELRHEAMEIVKSPFKADTANNNITSVGMDGGLEVVSSPYLTSASNWFLVSMPEDNGLWIYERQALNTKIDEDIINGLLHYRAAYREAVGVADWRGVVGAGS